MTRPIRLFEPDTLYFITNRTIQGRFLLRPSEIVNAIIGGVLARAAETYGVELFAFVFASNHFHLIVRAHAKVVSEFMGYFQGNLARKLAPEVDWKGPFWERRFSAEPILDDEALIGRLKYILAHGVKEGLVSKPDEWPGLTCIPELRDGEQRQFPWFDWTKLYRAKQKNESLTADEFSTQYTLRVSKLPCFADLNCHEVSQVVRQLLDEVHAEARQERDNKPVLGVEAVLAQQPHDRPKLLKRSRRPLCHASCKTLAAAFKEIYRGFVEAYHFASQLFREGKIDIEFPPHAFRPPLPHGWCAS